MTRAAIERAVRRWQRILGLDAWEIHLDTETRPSTDSAVMEVDRTRDYLVARIRLCDGWEKWTHERVGLNPGDDDVAPARSLDRMVAHELLHLQLHDLDVALGSMRRQVHPDAWALIEERFEHELERVVENVAKALEAALHAAG